MSRSHYSTSTEDELSLQWACALFNVAKNTKCLMVLRCYAPIVYGSYHALHHTTLWLLCLSSERWKTKEMKIFHVLDNT